MVFATEVDAVAEASIVVLSGVVVFKAYLVILVVSVVALVAIMGK